MSLAVNIPKYTSKDVPILVGSMLPMALVINYFLYGGKYFHNGGMFILATLVSFIFLAFAFLTYGLVAISLRNRFPDDEDLFKRLGICLSIFFLMSAVYISLMLIIYDSIRLFGYQYSDNDFVRCYFSFVVINTFLTFLNEGVYRFEKYRTTFKETEQLKKEYMHSQLLGLKSQLNPHFLFNSLNTLSSLIHEDAGTAEDFLDHMSKVYRYLLRNNEQQLVTIDTEAGFITSYFFLLKARYGEALHLTMDLPGEGRDRLLPPLTLQMIFENILNQNAISRDKPLHISITLTGEAIEVRNNVQPRISSTGTHCEVLENIANKYRLLGQQDILIEERNRVRTIWLPLITPKQMATA